MTIDQAVLALTLACTFGLVLMVYLGLQRVREASRLRYYLLRRQQILSGWRLIVIGALLGAGAVALLAGGKRVAYAVFPPTPSATPTPTVTRTPTITLTPTITPTPEATPIPSETPTPTATGTPALPERAAVFVVLGTVTPNPQAAFSPIEFATQLYYPAVNPQETFTDPVGTIYGIFAYDFLDLGVPWTALWYRGDEVVCFESLLWDGSTGGYGFTECAPEVWTPGDYEVQIFVGDAWKVSSRFTVAGAGTPTASP